MTQAEKKAEELVDNYYALIPRVGNFKYNWNQAIKFALICVDEILDVGGLFDLQIEFYEEVKQAIEKL